MYECPNCGGNLRFDIPSQQLMCQHCSTQMDPYSVQKDHDAEEENCFDATIFICPQCGGKLISTDNEATYFCSYCGASTILDSRMSKEKRPAYILPFTKTKEDCKKAYSKMMKWAIFAPKELKSEKYIDSFRGIYMPYWYYHFTQKGPITLTGTKKYLRGDYIITDYYNLTCNLDAEYNGLSFDASSTFADNLSRAIAPYNIKAAKKFTPSFLSGFYADTSDVSKQLYRKDAEDITVQETYKRIKRIPRFRRYRIDNSVNAFKLNSYCESMDSAMFPVWFLSYRNKDRIAYATVNGQTGKAAADIPIDPKKYLLGSLLLAIPLFVLLNLFLTLKPTMLLALAMLLAFLTLILYALELSQIVRKDSGIDDKGLMSVKGHPESNMSVKGHPESKQKKYHFKTWLKTNRILWPIFFILLFSFGMPMITFLLILIPSPLWFIALAGGIVVSIISYRTLKTISIRQKRPGFAGSLTALTIGTIIGVLNPVSDLFYYGGATAVLIAVFFTVLDLIYYYNILSTRRLPQFDKKGGDDLA